MAAPTPMDVSDASDMKRHGPLAVNKSSGKIGKGLRRPITQPRPAPQVYKIEAGNFRSFVQELTGTAPTEAAAPKPPGNPRLQKIAPPPLRPTFSYAKLVPPTQTTQSLPPLPSPTHAQRFNGVQFSGFSPLSQRMTPFPMLSPHTFSPLPALTPGDQVWATTLESPGSTAMRHLAQTMNGHDSQGGNMRFDNGGGGNSPALTSFPSLSPGNFPLSPRFPAHFGNIQSPGLGMASGFGISNIYGMGLTSSPTAGLAMDFAFPEPDFVSAGFS